jgi:hypothetical protein
MKDEPEVLFLSALAALAKSGMVQKRLLLDNTFRVSGRSCLRSFAIR